MGSYSTISPLPVALRPIGGIFLLHFLSGFLSLPVPHFHEARCPVVSGLSSPPLARNCDRPGSGAPKLSRRRPLSNQKHPPGRLLKNETIRIRDPQGNAVYRDQDPIRCLKYICGPHVEDGNVLPDVGIGIDIADSEISVEFAKSQIIDHHFGNIEPPCGFPFDEILSSDDPAIVFLPAKFRRSCFPARKFPHGERSVQDTR